MPRFKKGYIFTLDAFIALLLVIVSIGILYTTLHLPENKVPMLIQAYLVAHDKGEGLKVIECNDGSSGMIPCSQAIFDRRIDDNDVNQTIMDKLLKKIPERFHVAIDLYNSSYGSAVLIYNATTPFYNDTQEYSVMASYQYIDNALMYPDTMAGPENDELNVCNEFLHLSDDNGVADYDLGSRIRVRVYV